MHVQDANVATERPDELAYDKEDLEKAMGWEARMCAAGRALPFDANCLAAVSARGRRPGLRRGKSKRVQGQQLADPGQEIVARVIDGGDISGFIQEWRLLFMEMKPQHLPIGWGVTTKTTCAVGKHSRLKQN